MTDHVLDGDGNRREIYAGTYVGQLAAAPAPIQPAPQLETCPDCIGSGYRSHPDNADSCRRCAGSGGIAPQPDADEREAIVALIEQALLDCPEHIVWEHAIADALLAAGWTRKREEGR